MSNNNDYIRIEFPDGKKIEVSSNMIAPTSTETKDTLPKLYLSKEKGSKLDMIRIVTVLWELGYIVDEHGRKAMKKEVFRALGMVLNTDFSNHNSDLSGSLADGSSMNKHTRIFELMLEKMKSIFNLA